MYIWENFYSLFLRQLVMQLLAAILLPSFNSPVPDVCAGELHGPWSVFLLPSQWPLQCLNPPHFLSTCLNGSRTILALQIFGLETDKYVFWIPSSLCACQSQQFLRLFNFRGRSLEETRGALLQFPQFYRVLGAF